MRVLVGFEESQEVMKSFKQKGHDAYSCDIQESSGPFPQYHFKCDFFEALFFMNWDLVILHPPCTYTALCGNRWYWYSPLRDKGADLCSQAWHYSKLYSKSVALEQPKTIMQKWLGPKSQVIHPYQFGHGETKETWLWLHNLPKLKPTNEVDGRENRIWKMPPSRDRSKLRSKTYPGIAKAMAEQWG